MKPRPRPNRHATAVSARKVIRIAVNAMAANDDTPRPTLGQHIAEGCGDD